MCASGCSPRRIEYVTPTYAPLSDAIAKANPEPQVTEQNLKKWKDTLILMNDYQIWGRKESNRANSCVVIYQKTVEANNE
ncbi:hypothetical protein PT273_06265 [Orbaceae bacterium ESL0727]|nr:hypothetical protein [Orbaceae bacterium ESL0727]